MIKLDLEDLEEIIKIENEVFEDPWNLEAFKTEINNEFVYSSIIKEDDKVIGYGFISILYENGDIDNLAISKDYQGKGLGDKILNNLIEIAKENKVENILLEVRVSNLKAINLYKKNGFKIVRTIKSYYQNNYEDAYLMKKEVKHEEDISD